MIKALLLIFDTEATWDRIVASHRKMSYVLFVHLIPLLLLTSAAEGYGLVTWGKMRGEIAQPYKFPIPQTIVYEIGQVLLSLIIVFVGAKLLKSLGETFHGRHTYGQAFVAVAYGLSPMFLLRTFDAFPIVPPLISYAVGIILSIMIMYHGIPRIMLPDPPHAFGLYVISSVLLFMITGLARFATMYFLAGRFSRLDELIGQLVSHFTH
jgi:Yip1 domain